jgi:hypothetical protein
LAAAQCHYFDNERYFLMPIGSKACYTLSVERQPSESGKQSEPMVESRRGKNLLEFFQSFPAFEIPDRHELDGPCRDVPNFDERDDDDGDAGH